MKKRIAMLLLLALVQLCSAGCGAGKSETPMSQAANGQTQTTEQQPAEPAATTEEQHRETEPDATAMITTESTPESIPELAEETPVQSPTAEKQLCVAIDAGHQRRGNAEQEPVGPGATQTKAKVTGGTTGTFTGLPEYELNLRVSLLLRDELEERGYRVVMTRTENDVDISNRERAAIAERENADIFVRIHANGSDDPETSGALTICMTKHNPYCAALYTESRRLSDDVLNGLVCATGAKKRSVWETDMMSGINWAKMPVTIVEMGFMTNREEDQLLSTEAYQDKLARGIADGIDAYFSHPAAQTEEPQPTEQEVESAAPVSYGVQELFDVFVRDKKESWDVCFVDLTTGEEASAAVNLPDAHGMISASIIKIFIMGALYDEIERGTIRRDDVIDDIRIMIQNSNNDATNRLTKKLGGGDAQAGMERVTAFAASIGCGDTKHNRLMMDFNGKENYTTSKDCATILRMIYTGACVTPERSEEMLSIMKGQADHTRIHRYLPKGTPVADKPGALYEHSNGDVGIVFSPCGDYIICMISNEFQSTDVVKDNMAALSRDVYNYVQAAKS